MIIMRLIINFSEGQQFTPVFHEEPPFSLEFQEIVVIHADDWYDGPYEITPKVKEQIFPTYEKGMRDDLTVFAIPYAEVINISGGYTVTIGE